MLRNLTFLTVLIALLSSCESKEGSRLVYIKTTGDFELRISTIETKINSAGIAQCSKYAKTMISDTACSSYGLKLKRVIAAAYGTAPKYISDFPNDSINHKYLDVYIENYQDHRLNYDSIIRAGLSEAFQIGVEAYDSSILAYQLQVIDTNQLQRHKTECNGGVIKYNDGIWLATSSKLLGLLKILDEYSDQFYSFEVPDEKCYSFEFVSGNDPQKVNEKLKNVGLIVNKTKLEQRFYKVHRSLLDEV